MANTTEQILLTLGARNNASGVFGQVDRDAKNMASSISSAMSSINQGVMNMGAVTDNVMQGLTGKSALDNIFGTASKAETNKVLVKNMLDDTEKNFDSFYENVDKVTDSSLTSMQELMPALKAFKSATGATDKDVQSVTDEIANFGAAVLAQTGSTDMAQQSMMDLSKGIKGAFASLDQYGITQDALQRTGYWNGDEKDVKGFMKAVQKVTGSTEDLMETNAGLDAQIGKAFSRAGKKMGNEFLPVIKDIKRGFLDLDNSLGGNLTASILAVSAGVETANTAFWNISTTAQGIRDLAEGFGFLADKIKGVTEAAETASDAINTVSNVSDMGAGAGGAIGAGADIAGKTSKSEKAIDAGTNGLMFADLLKENKTSQKDAKKLLKDLDESSKLMDEAQDTIDYISTKESIAFKQILTPQQKSSGGGRIETSAARVKALLEGTGDFEGLAKQNESSRKEAGKLLEELKEFKSTQNTISDELDNIQTPKSNFQKVGDWFKNLFTGADDIADAVDVVDDVGDMGKDLRGAETLAEGVQGAAAAGSTIAAAGPEMEAAAAGGAAVEAGATGLAATFTSLMVPLLAVSAAIIIMIPIVAVIAAEALIFIKLLADFMEALNFDNINLDGAIKGISQVATALAWVGVAMAAMSFASIMTGLAVITGGFLGITGPLDIAVNAIKDVGKKLSQFNNLAINPSVATNLKTISDSLMAVSSAMGALTWTNITTGFSNWIAGALGFSSVTDGLEQAKQDIIEASSKLQEFSSMPVLDESVANNIQNVCDSLASVGDAMGALRSIRDGQNWDNLIGDLMTGLFGEGLDIGQALEKVKGDITNAASALKSWDNLDEIPDGLGDKIKKVSEALKSVSEAFETLRGFRDSNIWDDMLEGLFGGTDINTALSNVMKDINTASTKLSELSINDNINGDFIKKIQNVVTALTEVTNVANGLTNLPPMEDFNSENINSVVDNVKKASEALSGLTVGEVNEDIITTIKNVSNAMTEISGVMTTLTSLPPMDGFDPSQITTAVTNVQTAADELSKISGIAMGEDVNGVLGSINTALQTLRDTLANASGFTEPAINIGASIVSGVQSGLSPLAGTVTAQVSTATSAAASAGWTGGAYIGQSATGGFQSALTLHTVMEAEMGYVKTAVDNGISAAKSAVESGAKEIVEAFRNGVDAHSPGAIARTMKQEMLYTKDFIVGAYGYLKESAYNAAALIVDSFGSPKLNLDYFNDNSSFKNVDGLNTISSKVPTSNENKTIIMYNNVTVDARNKTEKEAKSMLTLALEGMDNITDIDVDV